MKKKNKLETNSNKKTVSQDQLFSKLFSDPIFAVLKMTKTSVFTEVFD